MDSTKLGTAIPASVEISDTGLTHWIGTQSCRKRIQRSHIAEAAEGCLSYKQLEVMIWLFGSKSPPSKELMYLTACLECFPHYSKLTAWFWRWILRGSSIFGMKETDKELVISPDLASCRVTQPHRGEKAQIQTCFICLDSKTNIEWAFSLPGCVVKILPLTFRG